MQQQYKTEQICYKKKEKITNDRVVGQEVTRSSLEREVRGSNLRPVKTDIVLPTARHRQNISSKGVVLPAGSRRNEAEMGPLSTL